MKYTVTKIIRLTWEVEASNKAEALAMVNDLGEHTGQLETKELVKKTKKRQTKEVRQ